MASIEEVWGTPFGKKTKVTEKSGVPIRDAEMEGRVFSNPTRRTEHALQKHKKIIDDLTNTLPIAETPADMDNNYHPPAGGRVVQRENQVEPFTTQYAPIYGGQLPKKAIEGYAYGPAPSVPGSGYGMEQKMDKILRMIDQNKTGYETPSTNDMLLYIFTGLFFLFTLDTFVTLGRKMR